MFSSLYQKWFSRHPQYFRRRPPAPKRCRPRLEALEDRCVPSTVTNLSDHDPGSLRDAIATTPSGGTVQFQSGLTGTITLTSGELLINKDLTISGPGESVITVSGNHVSRVFEIGATFTVEISGLTIANGRVSDTVAQGGGIFNAGMLAVTACTLSGNSASGSSISSQSNSFGGGIYSTGMLTVSACTLSGNSASSSSPLSFSSGGGIYSEGGTVAVSACTLSGNSASSSSPGSAESFGGGIVNNGGPLTVSACTFSGNSATGGGGIYNEAGTGTVSACTLSGNSASSEGGGIFNGPNQGVLTVSACTLSGNSAFEGGGINNQGELTVSACTFTGNSAFEGGGIANGLDATLTITSSTLSGNSASSEGGGIRNAGMLTVTSCTLSGNSVSGYIFSYGGGIYSDSGPLTVTSCTLSGNSVSGYFFSYGGGIYGDSGPLDATPVTVTSCTLSGNSAATSGGGLYASGVATTKNTIVAGNSAPSSPDLSGTLNSQGHNLIGDGTGGSGYTSTDLVGTSSNPIDPLLGPLQDNGGPTFTMALLPRSPAIGAGDPTDAPMYDQRGPGFPRVVNGRMDIGAFEVQAVALTVQCSVATPVLAPPDHQLVNVGLSVQVSDPSATVTVQVFADDGALSSDAADLAPGQLRLRGDRQGGGSGRVYLIVVTATDAAGDVAFGVCTVVVPHDESADALAAVNQRATDAAAFYKAFQTAPPGYALLG